MAADGVRPAAHPPLYRRRPALAAALVVLAHGVLVFVLVMLGISIALGVAGPTVGRDELYRMGPALQLAVAGAVLPLLVCAPATWLAALLAPRRAWPVCMVGVGASVVLWTVAMLFLHAPEPLPGG